MANSNTHDDDAPFVGADTHNSDDTLSPASVDFDFPLASNGIIMVSPPDTQDSVPQDVFHTPPEESSLPSSSDGVDRCAVNHAVNVDAGSQGFVDLGRDSDLGFPQVELMQDMDVDECSHGALGDAGNDFSLFEKEYSDLGESPVKKSKLSEKDLGFCSSGECFGVQLPKVEEGTGSFKGKLVSEEKEISVNKNCSEKVASTVVEGNKSSDGVVEASGTRKSDEGQGLHVLPPSILGRSENAASGMERGNSGEKKNVFDVLRALLEDSDGVEENLDNLTLLDVVKARGITFPRPRWWPDGDNFKP